MSKRSRTEEAYEKTVNLFGCPIEKIAEMANDPSLEPDLRLKALKEWSEYGNAKVKAVELTGRDGKDLGEKTELVEKIMSALTALRKK